MSVSAKEAGEEVEGVVAAATAPAVLVVLDALVAVAVVDLAGFLVGEDVVCFGDFDEFGVCGLVATNEKV